MREIEVTCGQETGKVLLRELNKDEIPGRAVKLIRAAALAAQTALSAYPQLFEPAPKGETDAERTKRLESVLSGVTLSLDQAMVWDNLREASAVSLIVSWTFDRPLPTIATIGTLPSDLYDALLDAAGGVSAAQLEEDFSVTPPTDKIGPTGEERPTGAFDGSNGLSKAEAQSPSTNELESAGESTASESSTA